MKKGIFAVLCIVFVYCIFNLFVVHETLIQIEHKEPLHVVSENALYINTENNENGYVTDIILPSTIFYNHAHIEIKSDIIQNIAIKFSGKKEAYKDTYKKYTIDYKKAFINTENIMPKGITASFLKPFDYRIDNLATARIDFDYKTDFVLRNMSLVYFIACMVTLLVIAGYCACFLYTIERVLNALLKIQNLLSYCFNAKDFLLLACNGYKNIRKEYKICFWTNFIILFIVYLYLNMNFLHGNHDWGALRYDFPSDYTGMGRFSIQFINLLFECRYLPYINNCLAFIFLSLTPIFLVKYWKIPISKFNLFAVSCLLLLHPQLLDVLFYIRLSFAYLLAPFLLVIGLILSEKEDYKISILSILILVFAIGDYNVCLNTLAVIFLGKMFLEYANGNSFYQLFKKYFRTILIICISCLVYFLIIQYLKYAGTFNEGYNTNILPFSQLLPRIYDIFIDSFKHFYLTYPSIDLKYLKLLSLLFVLMGMITLYGAIKRKSVQYFLGLLFIFVALVFSSKIVYCITETNMSFVSYVSYFSLTYIYVAAIAFILNSRLLWAKNLLVLLLIPVCYFSVLRNVEIQKYWKIALDGDKRIISQVVERIEAQDTFLYEHEYQFIFIGYYNSFSSSYYQKKFEQETLIIPSPLFPRWRITDIGLNFMPRTKVKSGIVLDENTSSEEIKNSFADIPKNDIKNLKPWPHKDSVLVYKDKIIVCWQEKELEHVKKALAAGE